MKYWLLKSDPDSYSWEDMKKDKSTHWDGVRNYQARNFMKDMKKDDKALFYHSGGDKMIVGIVKISKPFFQDPTTNDERWVAVQVDAIEDVKNPVSLESIKSDDDLKEIHLVKNSRLSVMPLDKHHYDKILSYSKD